MPNAQTHSLIKLNTMTFYAYHGVLPQEAVLGAHYEVDAELSVDITSAALTDDLAQTIDYGMVYMLIKKEMTETRQQLLETLAYRMAHKLLETFALVDRTTIAVRKLHPPLGGECHSAEVSYTFARS